VDPLAQMVADVARALADHPAKDARIFRTIDDYQVVVSLERNRKRAAAEVSDRGERIPRTLSLHRSRGRRRTTIGAPTFDQALELSAPEAWALAIFTPGTRSLVQVMVERWGAVVESGTIKLGHSAVGPVPDSEVLRTLRAALDLARTLSIMPERIAPALARNAAEDPEPRLRERALALLVDRHQELATDACRRALADPEPRVRLIAASSLPADQPVVSALAELATNWGIDPEIRTEAFERFLEIADEPMAVLERALADPILAERAVYATCRFAEPSWMDFLAEVSSDCDARLRAAIALVLADLGHARAEALLLEVPRAPGAVERLAEMGTARAIPVLRAMGSRAAEDAIARIKERTGDLSGHVALIEAEDNRGALSQTEAGRLSLEED
jgi:HEAT repeat protein